LTLVDMKITDNRYRRGGRLIYVVVVCLTTTKWWLCFLMPILSDNQHVT